MAERHLALSLWQPWATLVANDSKRIETRSFRVPYRGPLAVHASKLMPREAIDLALSEPFYSAIGRQGWDAINGPARGAIVAMARLVDCVRTTSVAGRPSPLAPHPPLLELAFGDYSPDRWMWMLEDVQPLPVPVPCRGALQLWEVPEEVMAEVYRQLDQGWSAPEETAIVDALQPDLFGVAS